MMRGLVYIFVLLYIRINTVMSVDVVSQRDISSHQESNPQLSEGTSYTSTIKPVSPSQHSSNSTISTNTNNSVIKDHEGKINQLADQVQDLQGKIEKLESESNKAAKKDVEAAKNVDTPNTDKDNTGNNIKVHTATEATKKQNDNNNNVNDTSHQVSSHDFKQNSVKNVETRTESNRSNVGQNVQGGKPAPIFPNIKRMKTPDAKIEIDGTEWNLVDWVGNLVAKEFSFFVRLSAIISNVIMSLTPLPSIIKVHNEKSTGNLSGLPYIMLFISTLMFSIYGYLSNKPLILISNTFGFLMSLIYVSIFHRNCHERPKMIKLQKCYKITGGIIIAIFTSCILFDFDLFTIIIGILASVTSFLSYAAPLECLPRIFKDRDTSCMPIEIILGNFWSCIFMLSYGFTIWDHFVIVPNFLGILAGSVQLGVLLIYPRKERGFTYIDDGIHNTPIAGTKLV